MDQNNGILEYKVPGQSYRREFLTFKNLIFLVFEVIIIVLLSKASSLVIGVTFGIVILFIFLITSSLQWNTKAEHLDTYYRLDQSGINIRKKKPRFYPWVIFKTFIITEDYEQFTPENLISQLFGFSQTMQSDHIRLLTGQHSFTFGENNGVLIRTLPDNRGAVIKYIEQFVPHKLPQSPTMVRYWYWFILFIVILVIITGIILIILT